MPSSLATLTDDLANILSAWPFNDNSQQHFPEFVYTSGILMSCILISGVLSYVAYDFSSPCKNIEKFKYRIFATMNENCLNILL